MCASKLLRWTFQGMLTVLLITWATTVMAQQGRVTGTVTDPAGNVVAEATVELINLASNRIRTTKVDGNGRYEFADLPDA
ncbi:MAG: carboxypeptidase-like regulatory domain-containing protein, partial [Acidobacteria bacterium]|nr:carboxypeptidase-like regulatory domain-containing protein [Acidobacteriota bacterium]